MKFLFAILFLISTVFVGDVLACQCDYRASVFNVFNNSSAVFTGKAVKTNVKIPITPDNIDFESEEEMIYEFEVLKSFKGVENKTVKINFGRQNMCDLGLELEETYLIYANGENEQTLKSGLFCSRTEYVRNAQDQIFFINEILNGRSEPQFYGSIELVFKEGENWKTKGLPKYKFFIEKDKKKIEIITDKNGNFKISKLKKGIYKTFVSAGSDYQPFLIELEQFRVLESGRAIPYDAEFAFEMSDKEIEKMIQQAPDLLRILKDYSKGVYLEITLK